MTGEAAKFSYEDSPPVVGAKKDCLECRLVGGTGLTAIAGYLVHATNDRPFLHRTFTRGVAGCKS